MTTPSRPTPAEPRRGWSSLLNVSSMAATGASLMVFGVFLLSGGFDLVRVDAAELTRLILNGLMSVLFFVQHSWMIRRSFRQWVARRLPPVYVRSVYGLCSSVVLLGVLLLWQGPMTVWASAEGAVAWVIRALFPLGVMLLGWAGITIVRGDPAGWRILGWDPSPDANEEAPLIEAGPYRWVRHPQYLATLLIIWSGPVLTSDRIEFNVLWSGWVLIGTRLEERDLLALYGQAYEDYRRRVPMLLPRWWRAAR